MIERIFQGSRALVLIAVFVTAVSSLLLYATSVNVLANTVLEFARHIPSTVAEGKVLAVQFLKLLDLLLISITLHLIAASLYRLFVSPLRARDSALLDALRITTFHDLEITLAQVAVVIMVILFLEQIVATGASLETLYFGASVALVIAATVHAWKNMK